MLRRRTELQIMLLCRPVPDVFEQHSCEVAMNFKNVDIDYLVYQLSSIHSTSFSLSSLVISVSGWIRDNSEIFKDAVNLKRWQIFLLIFFIIT